MFWEGMGVTGRGGVVVLWGVFNCSEVWVVKGGYGNGAIACSGSKQTTSMDAVLVRLSVEMGASRWTAAFEMCLNQMYQWERLCGFKVWEREAPTLECMHLRPRCPELNSTREGEARVAACPAFRCGCERPGPGFHTLPWVHSGPKNPLQRWITLDPRRPPPSPRGSSDLGVWRLGAAG
eukprot:161542-Chlamydomonas_euryale.AAC.5